jgi:hypothetical protein
MASEAVAAEPPVEEVAHEPVVRPKQASSSASRGLVGKRRSHPAG